MIKVKRFSFKNMEVFKWVGIINIGLGIGTAINGWFNDKDQKDQENTIGSYCIYNFVGFVFLLPYMNHVQQLTNL